MRKTIAVAGAVWLSVAGILAGSPTITIDPGVIVPAKGWPRLPDPGRFLFSPQKLQQLLFSLTNNRWRLPEDPDADRRFRVLDRYLELPDDLLPLPALENLDADRLIADSRLRYNNRFYHLMVSPLETVTNSATADRNLQRPGGWRWDISNDVKLILRGTQNINLSWGTDVIDNRLREGSYVRRVAVLRDFKLGQDLDLNLAGKIGPRINISIDHNSTRNENKYDISYKGLPGDFIREIRAGNVQFSLPASRYVTYSGVSKNAFGIQALFASEKFSLQAILSLTKGISETKNFTGQKAETKVQLKDIEYIKRQYFVLPDKNIDANSVRLYLSTVITNQGTQIAGGVYRLLVPGSEYSINYQTGAVNLAKGVTLDQNLLVTYSSGGSQIPSWDAVAAAHRESAEIDGVAFRFLYLKKVGQYSIFARKGIYRIGYANIDLTRGFQFQVVETESGARSEKVQFSTADYTLNQQSGLLEFNRLEPFDGYGVPETLYHTATDPGTADSTYTMELVFYHQIDSFQLRFNIIPGSEQIKLNNKPLKSGTDYTLDYMTGKLQFLIPIAENDAIEANYDYKPYSASLQRTLFGTRAQFSPVSGVTAGATLLYSGGQKPTGAPSAESPPDSRLVLDVDGKIDFARLLSLDSKLWTAYIRGEWAYSVHDRNTVDRALFADMEGDTSGSALTRNENSWLPASPSPNIDGGLAQSTRGRLLYRDYRDYGINDSYTLESYLWGLPAGQVLDYSRKPGPYTVKGGHNEGKTELNETSIVFEYDFSGGKSWVAAVTSVAGAGGLDLSKINQLLLSLKHQAYAGLDSAGNALYADNAGGSVKIFIEVGQLNEDADGDTVFDREATLGSGGFLFNPAGAESTLVGGGRRSSGNGVLDSEDLNRDNLYQTNEQSVVFPSAGFSDPESLSVPTGEGWQQYGIWIKNLDSSRQEVLRRVSAVRVTLVKDGTDRGRILLDRAWFKGTKWDRLTVDGNTVNGTVATNFKTAIISSSENDEYRSNRIYREYGDLFEDLHGDMSSTEEEKYDEKALQIKFDLGGSSNGSGSVAKVYNSKIDMTIYRKLTLFLYIKERTSDTNQFFIYRLANSADRYYEWRIPLTELPVAADAAAAGEKKWQKIEIHLDPDDQTRKLHAFCGDKDFGVAKQTPLEPNLREITRTVAGVDASGAAGVCSGELWLNEVHLSDDKSRKGAAWTVSGEFSRLQKPLLALGDFQLLGPFSLAFDYQNIGIGFKNLGDSSDDQSRVYFNASGSVRLLNFFTVSFNYADQEKQSGQDSRVLPLHLQFGNTNTTYKHALSFKHKGYWPEVIHSYTRKIVQTINHRLYTPDSGGEYYTDVFSRQYSEDALIQFTGKLPLGFSHAAKVSDSFFLTDVSERTNLAPESWFTNTTTQAYATYKKEASYQLEASYNNLFSLQGSGVRFKARVYRMEEANNRNDSTEGLRSYFHTLRDSSMLSSYGERMNNLFSGVFDMSGHLPGTNTSARAEGLTLSAEVKRFGFLSMHCSFDRSSRDANFVQSTNLIMVKNNATAAKGEAGLDMQFPRFPLRMVKAVFTRNFSFAQTAGTDSSSAVWNSFRGGFLAVPFHYLGLFGKGGRYEDLDYVARFKDSPAGTYVKLINTFSLSGRLDFGQSFLNFLTPDDWNFTLNQQTGRDLSTYSQIRSWALTVSKNFPLRKLKFGIFDENSAPGKKVGDLIWKWSWGRKYDYGSKIISDKLQTGVDWSVRWSRSSGFQLGYLLKYETGRQSLFAGDPGYQYMGLGPDTGAGTGDSFGDLEEQEGGEPPGYSELPQLTKWEHVIKVSFDFPTRHKSEISIFGIKIPMDPEWVHTNLFELHLFSAWYDKNRAGKYNFSELFDRTFMLKVSHAIGYDFSGSWNGSFYLTMVFEQWRLLRPDAATTGLLTEKFDLSFGVETGLKMKIRF